MSDPVTEPAQIDEDIVGIGEAARILSISIDTLRKYPDLIPGWTTPGGHRRYRRGDVIAYRDANRGSAS